MSVQPDTKRRQQIIFKILEFIVIWFTLCGFYCIHNIFAHLLAGKKTMMKRSYLNFMKSVFWRNITICIAGNCWEWNWKCMRKGFNILLLIPPSSQLELFSLRVVETVRWSWLEHVGIYREIPSEFVNDQIMNVGSLNTGKQIKKTNIAANKAPQCTFIFTSNPPAKLQNGKKKKNQDREIFLTPR